MARIFSRPKRVYVALVVLMVGLFALSGVGQTDGSSVSWIGAIGWFGFLLTVLVTLIYTLALAIRAAVGRRTA
ncbi:MAG: hypothetical protein QOF18_2601 [Frankiaceae bacterium]|nr:hypothetical protein [Frankiaceae bacterium]